MTNPLHQQIKQMIFSVLGKGSEIHELMNDQKLVSSGLLSSLQIVELASLIENDFGIDFGVIGFNAYYFESVQTIEDLIVKNQSPENRQ